MSLTRAECVSRTRTLVNEPTARFFTDAEIQSWVDDACRDISAKTFSSQIIYTALVTTSGVRTYAWPTITTGAVTLPVLGVKTIITSASMALQYVTPDLIGRTTLNEGPDYNWSEWDDSVIISPTPTAAFTLSMFIWVERGCTVEETLTIKSIYHHLVPLYCHYKAMIKRRDFESAKGIFSQYEQEMKSIGETKIARYDIMFAKESTEDQTSYE